MLVLLPFSGQVGQEEAEPEAATVAPRPAMVSGKARAGNLLAPADMDFWLVVRK